MDLEKQQLVVHAETEVCIDFELEPVCRDALLKGLDEITLTLEHEDAVHSFESTHDVQMNG